MENPCNTTRKNSKRKIQYVIAYVVAIASLTFGVVISWTAPALPKIYNNETSLEVAPNDMSWIVAMESPGFMAGSLGVRFLSDRLGRRSSILISGLPTAIGTILVAFANKTWQLLVARFLWGLAGGMYSSVVTLYLAELADKQIRGALITISRIMFNLGTLLIMSIGPLFSYNALNYTLLALPVIQLLGCLWIPESPYFLLMKERVNDAGKVLKRIRSYENDATFKEGLQKLKADVKNEMRHSGSIKELLTSAKYRKAVIIAIGLRGAHILTGQMVVSQYLGIILLESNITNNFPMLFIIFGVSRFVTSMISSFLSDRVGRRPLLFYSFLLTGICYIIGGIFFFFKEVLGYEEDVMAPYSYIPFICIVLTVILSSLGFNSTCYVVIAEIFPMNVKALATTGLCVVAGFLNFSIARGYQILKNVTGLYGIFWFFGAAGVFGAVFTLLYVPETKGKSLREVQEHLQGDLYEDDALQSSKISKTAVKEKEPCEGQELLELHRKEKDKCDEK